MRPYHNLDCCAESARRKRGLRRSEGCSLASGDAVASTHKSQARWSRRQQWCSVLPLREKERRTERRKAGEGWRGAAFLFFKLTRAMLWRPMTMWSATRWPESGIGQPQCPTELSETD
jgi:hypothetical protein